MKIKGFINLGNTANERSDEIDIPDEELEGLPAEERERVIYRYLTEAMYQYIEIWYEVI